MGYTLVASSHHHTQEHKQLKQPDYWSDLTSGTTSQYKEQVIERLLANHFSRRCDGLVDIGAGTCDALLRYREKLSANLVAIIEYDEKILNQMQVRYPQTFIRWIHADILQIAGMGLAPEFDLVFLMDMLHEVYSFYGRPDRNLGTQVDHALGLVHVRQALENVLSIMRPQCGIVISDNVLCPENHEVRVRLRRPAVLDAVRYFFIHYATKRIPHAFPEEDVMTLSARDFCILLTQYNKIKENNWMRWNVERHEIHQYMTLAEYRQTFADLGCDLHAVIGTPDATVAEWHEDFDVLDGLERIPEKRITLLAMRREANR